MTETLIQIPGTNLVVGVDGGGSTTVAAVAKRDDGRILGRGTAGPSNIQAVGVEAGLAALDAALDEAFRAAGLPRTQVMSACLGLAGVDWQGGMDVIRGWADRVKLAAALTVANDATLLLAAGTPDGWGLAVVGGTGSIAFAKSADGREARCGGWGYVLGDEGSGFQISLGALRAACRAYDGCGPATTLVGLLTAQMGLPDAPAMIDAVYRGPWDRAAISGLAPVVLRAAADGDAVAAGVVRSQAEALARTAAGAARNLGLPATGVPVALAGGVVLESGAYRALLLDALAGQGVVPGPVALVEEPVVGAVAIARRVL
jgi:N-acetylglucosamine kinase-like BadF-type ATPase